MAAQATPARAASTPAVHSTPELAASSPIPAAPRPLMRTLPNIGVPKGMVLVASPRLPLSGVGPEDPWRLLTGQLTNWAAIGSAVPIPVHPLALADQTLSSMRPNQIFESFEALTAAMAVDPGAVA